MLDRIFKVVLAYKRRLVTKLKRRSAKDRLKARTYYRKNKKRILLKRKRYISKNKAFLKTRKLYKRTKPAWYSKHKQQQPKKPKKKSLGIPKPIKPKLHKTKPKKPSVSKPAKMPSIVGRKRKVHAPKRV